MGNKSFGNSPFAKLKKQIAQTIRPAPAAPPRQKKKEEYTETELFASAMDDVQEIETFGTLSCSKHHPKEQPPPVRRDAEQDALAILGEITGGQRAIPLPYTQEYVEWSHPDHHESILPKLHEGHFSVQAAIDLHGFTVPEAEEELDFFLREGFARGVSCVKIIHGRGLRSLKGPRIKDAVIRRLLGKHRGGIIAFVSARQCDGGLGALYVLLARL